MKPEICIYFFQIKKWKISGNLFTNGSGNILIENLKNKIKHAK